MTSTNIADLRRNLGAVIERVRAGEEIEIRKRNVPVARIVPLERRPTGRTELGCGRGSAVILGDLTEPAWTENDWSMLSD